MKEDSYCWKNSNFSSFQKYPPEKRQLVLESLIQLCNPVELTWLNRHLSRRLSTTSSFLHGVSPIPSEILFHIFSFLDAPSLAACAQVCKLWHQLLSDNLFWLHLCVGENSPPLDITKLALSLDTTMRGSLLDSTPISSTFSISSNLSSPSSQIRNAFQFLTASSAPWKQIYKANYITFQNWRSGRCKVSSVKDVLVQGKLCLQFDETSVISVAMNEGGRMWNLKTGNTTLLLTGHEGFISTVKFDDNIIVTGSVDSTLKVWDIKTGQCLRTLRGHDGEIVCVHFSDLIIVTGSEDKTIMIWDRQTGQILGRLRGHGGAVCSIQLLKRCVISGDAEGKLKHWDVSTMSCLATMEDHRDAVYCLQFNDKRLITGSGDTTIKVWDMLTYKCTRTLRGHRSSVLCLQFDNTKILSGSSDKTIKIWDYPTGQCLYTLYQHAGGIWNLRFSASKLISSSFDQKLFVWDFSQPEINRGELKYRENEKEETLDEIAYLT